MNNHWFVYPSYGGSRHRFWLKKTADLRNDLQDAFGRYYYILIMYGNDKFCNRMTTVQRLMRELYNKRGLNNDFPDTLDVSDEIDNIRKLIIHQIIVF